MVMGKQFAPIVMLLIWTLVPASGFPVDQASSSIVGRAIRLTQAGHTQEAIQLLRSRLAARPNDLKVRIALADIDIQNGKTSEAETVLREGVRVSPGSAEAEMALGAFYIKTRSLDAAERTLREAVRQHPELNESRVQLALVLALQHKYEDADSNIRLVSPPADPNARILYYRLAGSIYSGLGDMRAAAHATEQALQAAPTDPQLQLAASIAEAEASEWESCLRNVIPLYKSHPGAASGLVLLQAQLATHQDFSSTLSSLRSLDLPQEQALELRVRTANILAVAEKHDAAVDELQGALKLQRVDDDTLLYDLAVEQYRAHQLDGALSTLASLHQRKDSAAIEDLSGDIEEQKGDSVAAVHSYQNAISLNPQEEQYRLSLGAELLKYHTYEPAVLVFRQAAELFPKSTRIYVGLGMAYFLQGNYDESVSAFLRADALDRGSSQIINYLGETQMRRPGGPDLTAMNSICGYAEAQNPTAASVTWCAALRFQRAYIDGNQASAAEIIKRLHSAVSLSPSDPAANCSLGHVLEWTAQLTEARHWLETCVALRPGSAEDHFRLSRVYQRLGFAQLAKQEAELTEKASVSEDQRDAITKSFIYEMQAQPDPKTILEVNQKPEL
jgi:predicted Zn-dependent protease